MIPFGAFRGDIPWVIAFSLIILTLFQFLFHKRITERLKSGLWIWFFALYAISLISAMLSKYPELSYQNLYLLAVGYMFFALNLIFLSQKSLSRTLPIILIVSISIGALLGISGYILDIPFLKHNIGTGVDIRAKGTAQDPNNFSLMLIFCIPLLVYWFFNARSFLERSLIIFIILIDIYGIIMSYSRTGAIVFTITTILLLITHRKKFHIRYLGLLMMSAAIAILLIITLVPSSYWVRQKTMTETKVDPAIERRKAYIIVAWDTIKKYPILGTGPGTFMDVYAETTYARHYKREVEPTFRRYAHNTYLEHLIGTGILGFIVVLIIIWKALRNFKVSIENCKNSGKENLIPVITSYRISFISVLLFLIFFSDVYHKYLLLSLALSQVALRVSKEETEKELGGPLRIAQ
jgi:O-antigen ligase